MNHFKWISPLTRSVASSLYDFRVEGQRHIPQSGGFIVASNHVTYLDWVFIMAAFAPKPVRFLIDENFTNAPGFKQIIGFSDPIPVCVDSVKPKMIKDSMARVVSALQAGDAVGMFPEGGLTRTGELRKFRSGVELLAKQAQVPVVPIALTGLWGSILSWSDGKVLTKMPKGFRLPVVLRIGEAISHQDLTTEILRSRIAALQTAT